MYRERLINFRGLLLTPDTAAATEKLLSLLDGNKWAATLRGPSAATLWDARSLILSGREVWIKVSHPEADAQSCLDALWGHAVPLGFTPWQRYPLTASPGELVFDYFGPWQLLFDSLLSEGRGHQAWPSLCAAAQCDVGTWKGDKFEGRFIQAQLHRIGFPCGPIDGVIGARTMQAVTAAGLAAFSSQQLLERLCKMQPPQSSPQARRLGHLALPGQKLVLTTSGGVRATQTVMGALLTIDGPGQLIVGVGDQND